MKKLTDKNFILFAAQHYDNPECEGVEEFHEDLNRLKYVKRILRKYNKNQTIDHKAIRLLLNHVILLVNVFGPQTTSRLLFFKIDDYLYSPLKTILMYLHALPRSIDEININDISLDDNIIKLLREI